MKNKQKNVESKNYVPYFLQRYTEGLTRLLSREGHRMDFFFPSKGRKKWA